jgi:hypothetical protein
MELNNIEEIAPLTEEQWHYLISWYRDLIKYRRHVERGLTVAKQFQASIEELERQAGHSQEQLTEVSQALLDIAQEE